MRHTRILPTIEFPQKGIGEINICIQIEIAEAVLVKNARLPFPKLYVIKIHVVIGVWRVIFAIARHHYPFSPFQFFAR